MLAPMELRQLRFFVAVAETGNISRAAKKIFLTQPALSRQIKALETELGQCLLERQAHSIRLTPAGELLLHDARELLIHADQVVERVRRAGAATRLRIGYAPSLASGLLSMAAGNFSQAHPGARLELADLSTAEMLAGLRDETLDVIVTAGSEDVAEEVKWTPLVRAPWRLAVGRQHALARRGTVSPAEVARHPLLMLDRRDYPEYWERISVWLGEHRQRLKIAGEYDGAESLMAAVEAGLGVALVPTRTAHLFRGRALLKNLSDGPPPLCIAAGCRPDALKQAPLAVFIEDLRRAARSFE